VARLSGARLRLETSLLPPDPESLWSGNYDGDLDDAFDWQDETAENAAIETVSHVLDRERLRLDVIVLEDRSAEECLIASMMAFALLDEPSMTSNLAYLASAIKKNPTYVNR